MSTKTISVDLEACEILRAARRTPSESFSQVIKRATWADGGRTAARFLAALPGTPTLDRATLRRLDVTQRDDAPPRDRWTG